LASRVLLIISLLALSSFSFGDSEWVSVPRPEKVVHQLEREDHSIWVVFAKTFGEDRVLLRFPEDPVYHRAESRFDAFASHLGVGEMSLIAQKKEIGTSSSPIGDIAYFDAESGRWIRERHIDTDQHHFVLRVSHPSQSSSLFRQFTDSFEIERGQP